MYENRRLGFLFVLPFVLGVLGFKLFPFVMSFALSFTQYDLIDPPEFTGFENYRELFGNDPLFRKSLGVTLLFAALAVPLRVGFALFIAHVLNYKLRGISLQRLMLGLVALDHSVEIVVRPRGRSRAPAAIRVAA